MATVAIWAEAQEPLAAQSDVGGFAMDRLQPRLSGLPRLRHLPADPALPPSIRGGERRSHRRVLNRPGQPRKVERTQLESAEPEHL